MASTTRVTAVTNSGVSTHEISMQGLVGVIFWVLLAGIIIYVLGFATPGWQILSATGVSARTKIGLWDVCTCGGNHGNPYFDSAWFDAVRAMITIGLILVVLAMVALLVYMFFHKIGKNWTLLALVGLCFGAVLFMFIGFVVFGVETAKDQHGGGNQNYSYALCIIGAFFTLAAGIVGCVQMSRSK